MKNLTRKVEMCCWCIRKSSSLMRGYMMGSPTSDKAQCSTLLSTWLKKSLRKPGSPKEETGAEKDTGITPKIERDKS